ncbi:tape measure protein [Acinetobacter phage Effie]|nr:tape measure protein [Acinetobacter phage Effie]
MVSNTLHIIIDPSGAQRGSAQTVQAINSIVNATTNLNIQINQTNNNLDRVGRAADRNSTLLRKMSNAWLALKSAMILSIPLKMFDMMIDKIISVDRSYQQFMASMYVSTSSMAKSKEAFDFVARAARAYGVELETLSKSYAKFRASASATLPTAAIDRLFLSVSAVASVLHMAPQSVDRMFTAFTQMASKGQIYSEELKQQLGEHLPGAVALAAQAMGVSVRQLMDDMKKGKVDIVKFFSNMPDVIMEKFGKAAEISALSIQSQINNLKSTIYRNFVELNNSGAAMGLAKFIQSIDNILQPTSEHFKVFGKVVGEAFLKAADFINALTPEEVAKFAEQLIAAASALIQLVAWLAKVTTFVVQNGEAIVDLAIAYGALRVAVWGYTAAAAGSVVGSSLAAKGLGVLGRIAAVVAAFFVGWQIGTVLKEKFLSVELFGIALARKLHQIVQGFIDIVKTMISIASASVRTLAEGTVNSISGMATAVVNLVPGVNIQAPKVNFGASDAWGKVAQNAASTVGNWNQIGAGYDGLAADAIDRKYNKSDRIPDMSNQYGSQIEEQHKLNAEFEKLKAEADEMLAKMPKDDKSSGDTKKKAAKLAKETKEVVGYINEIVSNLKQAYDDKIQLIKNMVEAEEYSPTQGYLAQIEALKSYTSQAQAEIMKALNRQGLTMKMKADLQGKYIDLERNMVNETKKLQTEMLNERRDYLNSIADLEQEVGVKRLTELDKFVQNWERKYSKLAQRAQKEGDTAMIGRIESAARFGVSKAAMIPNDKAGYSEFDAAKDKKSNHGDLFQFDSGTQYKAVIGEYDAMFRQIQPLIKQGTITEQEATRIHNDLMMARVKATRDAATAVANARVEIGAGTWGDGLVSMLADVADGFRNIKSSAIQTFKAIGKSISQHVSQNLTDVITGAQTLGEAFNNIARSIIEQVLQAIIQMGIQWAATMAMSSLMSKAVAVESTATAAASGAAITTAMTPAAATTSLATMGANTVTASAGVLAFGAVMAAMLGALLAGAFDNGGYIPDGKFGIVGEYGPEIIQGPVAVTGRKTTEDIISSATSNKESMKSSMPSNDQSQLNATEVKSEVHNHHYKISAMDARSFEKYIGKNSQSVAKGLKGFNRNFKKA